MVVWIPRDTDAMGWMHTIPAKRSQKRPAEGPAGAVSVPSQLVPLPAAKSRSRVSHRSKGSITTSVGQLSSSCNSSKEGGKATA